MTGREAVRRGEHDHDMQRRERRMKRVGVIGWTLVILALVAWFASPTLAQWAEITVNKISQANTAQPITVETDGDGVRIGTTTVSGTAISVVRAYLESLTPSAISAGACGQGTATLVSCSTTQTFTVTGLSTSDHVFVNPPYSASWPAGSVCPMVSADVSATNTLRLRFAVVTTAACTPTSGVYSIFALRRS